MPVETRKETEFEPQKMFGDDIDGLSGPHWKGVKSLIISSEYPEICMIPAEAVDIIWGNDPRFWKLINLSENEKRLNGFDKGAMLLQVNWIEVTAKVPVSDLRTVPNQKFEVRYLMKFQVDAFGWHSVPIKFMIRLNGKEAVKSVVLQPYKERHGLWHEINGGEFMVSTNPTGLLEIGMLEVESPWWKGGMVLAGIKIMPKAT